MKTIVIGLTLTTLAVLGSLWALIIWAFGEMQCVNVNVPGTIIVAFIAFMVLLIAINSTDWLNDMIASRAVSKSTLAGTRELAQAFRAQAAASAAMGATAVANKRMQPGDVEPEPTLRFDPGSLGLEGIRFPTD